MNHLTVSVDLYVKSCELEQFSGSEQYTRCKENLDYTLLKVVEPEDMYNVPLCIAYHCKIYVKPSVMG